MLYVERNEQGEIVSVRREDGNTPDFEAKQALDEEILDFLCKNSAEDSIFRLLDATDLGIIRVLEDLIDLLVSKNLIMFSELPVQAQKKLRSRQHMREQIAGGSLIISDEDIL
ncbi:MAG: hypothetical protein A2X81_10420 [Desulfobacterales bacterium GWB2_56_26]|nr:MAG: hypothetical protein A2X81_10420 [Desulfobacterales bacterium GWB2_56_26]HBG21053.1 hypothetical protein [Desulfobulbaceae bacterium]